MKPSGNNAPLPVEKIGNGNQQSAIVATQMTVCHEGAQEDEVLRAAMLPKR